MMKDRFLKINNEIDFLCNKNNIDRDNVVLLPVSKTQDVSKMEEAIELGYTVFGENKVQEILKKYEYFNGKVKFHMIGHLQTNKVKYIIDKVELIQSLDRISLLDKIDSEAKKRNIISNCLVEVNIGLEESKSGVKPSELIDFIKEISKRENVMVHGLMTVAPFFEDPENTRIYFKKMKLLFEEVSKLGYSNVKMNILSMGMSNDFNIAIEEGANLVRIGTSIFGHRDYNKK